MHNSEALCPACGDPAGEGKPATLVLTDIEGSTELWEWDSDAMMEALNLHDRIIRSQLAQYCGYEVSTEGDAFLLVFHEAVDAVSWALAIQQVCAALSVVLLLLHGAAVLDQVFNRPVREA